MTDEKIDIYADGMEPKTRQRGIVWHVKVPGHETTHWADVLVSEDGYCELPDWRWGDQRSKRGGYRLSDPVDKARWEAERGVWEWLAEWELVELKPVGPEDSEYFAAEAGGLKGSPPQRSEDDPNYYETIGGERDA